MQRKTLLTLKRLHSGSSSSHSFWLSSMRFMSECFIGLLKRGCRLEHLQQSKYKSRKYSDPLPVPITFTFHFQSALTLSQQNPLPVARCVSFCLALMLWILQETRAGRALVAAYGTPEHPDRWNPEQPNRGRLYTWGRALNQREWVSHLEWLFKIKLFYMTEMHCVCVCIYVYMYGKSYGWNWDTYLWQLQCREHWDSHWWPVLQGMQLHLWHSGSIQ